MNKTVWTFGLISGVILSAMMVASMRFVNDIGDRGEIIGYTTMVLAFLLVYFGVRSYRDNVRGGTISFGRALAVGTLIMVVASACYVATWEVIYFKFEPDFATKYEARVIEKAKASGDSPEVIAQKTRDMEKFATMYKNPIYNVALTFLEPLPVGLVMVFVSAAVLRRNARGAEALATPSAVPS